MTKESALIIDHTGGTLLRAMACAFVGFLSAGLAASIYYLATGPSRGFPLSLLEVIQLGWFVSLILTCVPGLVLGAVASVQRGNVSALCVLAVAMGWQGFVFLWRARKPWDAYGEFAWFMFWRDSVPFVPAALAFALGFMVTARCLFSRPEAFRSTSVAA